MTLKVPHLRHWTDAINKDLWVNQHQLLDQVWVCQREVGCDGPANTGSDKDRWPATELLLNKGLQVGPFTLRPNFGIFLSLQP